jgi:3-deoxy-D-manno-octulosonic-acid transferase
VTRLAYNLLLLLAVPLGVLHLLVRGLLKDRGYWRNLGQRFGFGPRAPRPTLWVHAVSFGEMQAAAPLVRTLRQRHPQYGLVVTTFTPTGLGRARSLFGESVDVRYVPFDLPGAVARFLDRARPRLVVIMETELWPNLFGACGRRGIPLLLASARLSPRSIGRYRHLVPLIREALSRGIVIGAQTRADAERFVAIGAPPGSTHVTGNAKFDFEPDAGTDERARQLRARYAPDRPVWIAGSTHEGEETIVLDAHERVRERLPGALLLLVPRHPHRFANVAALLEARGLRHVTRSSGAVPGAHCPVMLVDTLGELTVLYGAADVAFVGGSLIPVGGHNLLEPASMRVPIVTGPHNFHAAEVLRLFVAAGAACVVTDAATLAAAIEQRLVDPLLRGRAGAAGLEVVQANRGSVRAVAALVEPLLTDGGGAPDG